ncbi:unnamed protein product [Candida verbasci]|uniref:Amino acid permease/ SLC12A domain-containing protein n=1 Tax=Candida verbasci TaxID=1227364 RepID=A0A9W4TYU2_9ASCO|nr:unnamed protein product [Candida verbasci]
MSDFKEDKKGVNIEIASASDLDSLKFSDEDEIEAEKIFGHDKSLAKSLNSRLLNTVALVGTIGTGLFLSSGGTLATTGPVGLVIAYLFVGSVVGANQICACEVSCLVPVTGGYIAHSNYLVDPALSFMLGWISVYSSILPTDLSASAVLMTYWSDLNPAVWITVFGIVTLLVNLFSVRVYTEFEFIFGILKLLLCIIFIITGLVIDLGGVPGQERLGFHYWKTPFESRYVEGSVGKFLAFWKSVSSTVYAFGGLQTISFLAGECEYPRRAIYRASKRIFYRVFTLYILTIFIISLVANSRDPLIANPDGTAAGSAFVIAVQRAGIKGLPHFINAVVLTSSISATNLGPAETGRIMWSLASKGFAPKFFLKTNRFGLPWVGITFASMFLPLAYMSVDKTASTVFGWFQNITSSKLLVTWCIISINSIKLNSSLKSQGFSRS